MYDILIDEITFKGFKRAQIAQKIGITEMTLRRKLKGDSPFYLWEAIEMKKAIGSNLPLEVLFSEEES